MFNNQTEYRFEKILNKVFLFLFIIGLATTTWLAISNTSIAVYINLLQALLLDGDYMPVLTALILIFPLLIILILLKTICVLFFNLFFVREGQPKIPYAYKLRWK